MEESATACGPSNQYSQIRRHDDDPVVYVLLLAHFVRYLIYFKCNIGSRYDL